MITGGLQRVSLNDFPGRICAVIFTRGCNFRCPYCHNPELVNEELFGPAIPQKEVLDFLKTRRGRLEGVSITGGEPTVQADLPSFIAQVKELGMAVKLDTNGSSPEMLKTIIKDRLLDYLAMDLKGPVEKYPAIVRAPVDPERIKRSAGIIMGSEVPYEFRTTVHPSLLSSDDLARMIEQFKITGSFVLQRFIPSKTLDASFLEGHYLSEADLLAWADKLKYLPVKLSVR